MTKNDIRKRVSESRPDFQTLEKRSATIIESFRALELFQRAQAVGLYMPLPDEVNINPFFQTLEKPFFIPAFDTAIDSYRMAKYTPDLKKGRFGIPEPASPVFATADEIDLIAVPGVAFDRTGGRVGRGGGFYDRLLPQYRAARIGICFDFQCFENVPADEHDICMDSLLTESEILHFATNIRQKEMSQVF